MSAASVVKYGFAKENGAEVLKRIHFLQLAGLVGEYGANKFEITQAGEMILRQVSIQHPPDKSDEPKPAAVGRARIALGSDELLSELRLASRDSANPNRFEKACAGAFRALGFKAEWLGGSGKTDVLVSSYSAAKYSYRVSVDAKSTANGLVNESQLNFDTLVDHRRLHEAQYAVVVGCGFQGERIVMRAAKHGIVLIGVDSLCDLVKLHEEVPLGSQDYRSLFEKSGLADLSVLEAPRTRLARCGDMLYAVMDCLASESGDTVTGGTLSVRELYFLLKSKYRNLSPSIEEISSMLAFLSSPLVNCVGRMKDKYYAIGSLNEASNKFSFYSSACLKR